MARRERLQDDICCRRQTPKKLSAVLNAEVEGHAALGGVVVPERQTAVLVWDIVEKGPHAARGLAAERLDLDDIGAQITEQLAAELSLLIGQLQNSQSCKRAGLDLRARHFSISSR